MCLDNEDVRAKAEKFLVALVVRYRDHPATLCYDLWNENSFRGGSSSQMYCFCEATQKKFREWLKKKYGTLEVLGRAWHRYSYASWDNVPPTAQILAEAPSGNRRLHSVSHTNFVGNISRVNLHNATNRP